MRDLTGSPAALLRTSTPRRLLEHGLQSARRLLAVTISVGLVFGALTLLLVERLNTLEGGLFKPSGRPYRAARERIEPVGADELSRLAGDINGMLGSLEYTFAALH